MNTSNVRCIHFIICICLLLTIIHGYLRTVEFGRYKVTVSADYFVSAVNYAAGKGFIDDMGFLKSSELKEFYDIAYGANHTLHNPPNSKNRIFEVYEKFSAYETNPNWYDTRNYAPGHRLLVGWLWKVFGFSWSYVIYLNYFLSLLALMALFDIGYRLGGISTGIIAALIYCISPQDIYLTASIGRDGMPLWFAVFLVWFLIRYWDAQSIHDIRNFKKSLSYVAGYAGIVGILISLSIQGRSSNIYFLPLWIIFIFIESVRYGLMSKTDPTSVKRYRMAIFFFIALLGSCIGYFSINVSLNHFAYGGQNHERTSHTMTHAVFSGLGLMGFNNTYPPYQARFDDSRIMVQANEYARRAKGLESIGTYSREYSDSLRDYYVDILTSYPSTIVSAYLSFFLDTIVWLARPLPFFSLSNEGISFIHQYHYIWFSSFLMPLFSLLGLSLIIVWKNNIRAAIILVGFACLNAAVSGIQFHARHVVMAYPIYILLWSVAINWLLIRLPMTISHLSPSRNELLRKKKYVHVIFLVSLILVGGLVIGRGAIYALDKYEKAKIMEFQKYVQNAHVSAKRVAVEDGAVRGVINLPVEKNLHGIVYMPAFALVLDMGHIGGLQECGYVHVIIRAGGTTPGPVRYQTRIQTIPGGSVKVLVPLYHYGEIPVVEIESYRAFSSIHWIDLNGWKGALWEGAYDNDCL